MESSREIKPSDDIIKQGWIVKRSRFLKVWRQRLLVLTNIAISTYKSSPVENPTMYIPLGAIKEVLPSPLTSFYGEFQIETEKEIFLIQAENDTDMCEWCNSINKLLKEQKLANIETDFEEEYAEKKLIHEFYQIKSVLFYKEEELLARFQEIFEEKLKESQRQVEFFEEKLIEEEKVESEMNEIRSLNSSTIDQIKYFSKLKISLEKPQEIEEVNQEKIVVSLNKQTLETIITTNIKPQIINPNEIQIRRTNITRALKWRHSGDKLDALTFSVNSSVKLTAIGVCRPFRRNRVCRLKSFKVLRGPDTQSKVVYSHPEKLEISYCEEESTKKIELKNEIIIEKGKRYSVVFCMSGSHTYKCVDCKPRVRGNVNWSFYNTVFTEPEENNRCDVMCGPIADFYYIPLSE